MCCSKTFLLLVICAITSGVQSQCEFSEQHQNCAQLFRKLQGALFDNKDNLFVLQSVFYPGTQITPVLVKFVYKLNTSSCQGSRACTFNQPTVCGNDSSYTFGWTIRGIYKIFHPSIINQLRIQLPFWLLQVSERLHNLTLEFDVEAFLWDGGRELKSVDLLLNLDFSNDDCELCSSNDLLEQALGELTQWLRAYAKVAQEEVPKSASPRDKAIALQCTIVEKYNRFSLDDRDNDARLGVQILRFGYSIGFIITFIMSPLFMRLLFTIINNLMFPGNSDIGDPTGSNSKLIEITGRQDDSESQNSVADNNIDNYNYKPLFMAGSAISFIYSASSISIGGHQAISRFPLNEFEYMKMIFLFVLVVWLTVIAVFFTYMYNTNSKLIKKVVTFFCALSLAVFTANIMLSFVPTFLLFFAFPISSSALLVLHIAIFYCTIILLAVYFSIVHKWITKPHKMVFKIVKKKKNKHADLQTIIKAAIDFCWFVYIIIGLLVIALLPLTYICILFFYQFVITRSNTTNIASNGIALYIPSLVIAVFGFLVKKGAFERRTNKEEEEERKAKRMLQEQAIKIWSVFGHRLLEGEGNDVPLGQTKIKDLAQKLKKPSKGETRGS